MAESMISKTSVNHRIVGNANFTANAEIISREDGRIILLINYSNPSNSLVKQVIFDTNSISIDTCDGTRKTVTLT